MITRLSKEEYYLIANAASRLDNSVSITTAIERLRTENSELDEFINNRLQDDSELLASFIATNSRIYYEAEVTEEMITKVTYIRRFDHPVTESSVETEFCENPQTFYIDDESEEYRDCLDCSLEKRREMEQYETLKYSVFLQPQSSIEEPTLVELGHNELHIDRLASSANVRSWTTSSL